MYNARYYAPLIGRFISPDTIVPDPADPQAFNRYSYCLNNLPKYTDPSGHIVEISDRVLVRTYESNGYKVSIYEKKDTLGKAWELFKSVAPDVANYLEESEDTFVLQYSNLASGIGGSYQNSSRTISIDSSYMNNVALSATTTAHEVVHAIAGKEYSIFEETTAYQFQYYVASEIGKTDELAATHLGAINLDTTLSMPLIPTLPSLLEQTRDEWVNTPYSGYEINPSNETYNSLSSTIISPYLNWFDNGMIWMLWDY